jgi:hypothetical protein
MFLAPFRQNPEVYLKAGLPANVDRNGYRAMLKRFSSLILALVIGSSVLAGTVRPSNEHVCKMVGMEMVPGMHMPTASPSSSHSHQMMAGMEMMPGMEMTPASPSLSHSHEMMPGMEMPPGMEMMPGMEMPTAPPSLSQSHEMMPGMEMPTASLSLNDSHEMMSDMERRPGMEAMPCCMKHRAQSVSSQSGSQGQCCINIPQETGSSGTKFSLRPPAFSVAVNHPATVHPPITVPKPYEWSYSTEVFLPNLQASYLRNLSFLI